MARWLRDLSPIYLASIVLCLMLVAIWGWWIVTEPGRARRDAAGAKAGLVVATGDAKATEKAAGAIADYGDRQGDRNTLTQENADAIRQLPGAQSATPAGYDDGLVRRLCLRDANANDPRCVRLRKADSAAAPH